MIKKSKGQPCQEWLCARNRSPIGRNRLNEARCDEVEEMQEETLPFHVRNIHLA